MKWRGRKGTGRIEDRRGTGGGFGGGGMPFPLPLGKAGGGGLGLIVLIVIYLLVGGLPGGGGGGLGIDPGTGRLPQAPASPGGVSDAPKDDTAKFAKFVAGDVDAVWQKIFAASETTYEPATVVLFEQGVQSGCGSAPSSVGPFYCPSDRKVYVDFTFLEELQRRLGAPGDFAQAYVIAHEIGHHVQNLLGVMDDVNLAQQENPDEANELSVRLELQADCLAGIWAHSAYAQGDLLESGDIEEGLAAAAAVGDDRVQQRAGQGVNPESFTHGSSEQRVQWFRKGFESGDPTTCDTFKGDV
jgi:predicted metalloprotease